MNNIQAKDWAEDDWGWHSGMSSNPYEDDVEETGEIDETGVESTNAQSKADGAAARGCGHSGLS